MGAIPLDQVQCGMVLERDVVGAPDRRLLLAAGATLTDSHLVLLRMWGVAEVDVREVSRADVLDRAARSLGPDRRRAVEAEVQDLFHHADRAHPAVTELIYLATLRRLRREAGADADAG
jgi:hypothetical protein